MHLEQQVFDVLLHLEQMGVTTTPTNAPLLESAFHHLDITDLARRITTPTLVMHATRDRCVPLEEGRYLAGLVRGARFVALESRNHILLERATAFAQLVQEIEQFVSA